MLDVLIFVFSDFWHWLGFAILLGIIMTGVTVGLEAGIKILLALALGRRR